MSIISGYHITFLSGDRVKQVTIASADDALIVKLLGIKFDRVTILSRAPLDAWALDLMKLEPSEWLEWVPRARRS